MSWGEACTSHGNQGFTFRYFDKIPVGPMRSVELKSTSGYCSSTSMKVPVWIQQPYCFASFSYASVCSLGIANASFSLSSSTVLYMGGEWANSGNAKSRTSKNGSYPEIVCSTISHIRAVFEPIVFLLDGAGKSV